MIRDARENEARLGESVVDEIREIRETIDREVDHDVRRLAQTAREVSAQVSAQYGLRQALPSDAISQRADHRTP